MLYVDNVTIKYKNNILLKDFSCTFNKGINIILGKSGCGKTTLLRCIAGLKKVSKGLIRLDNNIINAPNKDILMIHQHYTNFPWKNCQENLLFPMTINSKINNTDDCIKKIDTILNKLELEDSKFKYPSELSGGMNQRLSFGKLFVINPKVALLDEPFSALDEKTLIKMEHQLIDFQKENNNIIIMVTHNEEQAYRINSNNIIKL